MERINYKIKSVVTVAAIVVIMVTVGILVNYFQGGITGDIVGGGVACDSAESCSDGVMCTIDSCKNPGTDLSFCVNTPIDFCQDNDGCCPAGCSGSDSDC